MLARPLRVRPQTYSLYGNCMMRRFDDNPRWVSHRAHNKTDPITTDLAHLRWFYRYHIPRGERDCKYRWEVRYGCCPFLHS